jgi:hypothetical protein
MEQYHETCRHMAACRNRIQQQAEQIERLRDAVERANAYYKEERHKRCLAEQSLKGGCKNDNKPG